MAKNTGCTLVFVIGDQEIRVPTNSISPTSSFTDIVNFLIENPNEKARISEALQDSLGKSSVNYTKEEIQKNGLQANMSINALMTRYPTVNWPKGTDDILKDNVLLVNKTSSQLALPNSRIIDANGTEVFVIQNNIKSVIKFSKFLQQRDAINKVQLNKELQTQLDNIYNIVVKEFKQVNQDILKQNEKLKDNLQKKTDSLKVESDPKKIEKLEKEIQNIESNINKLSELIIPNNAKDFLQDYANDSSKYTDNLSDSSVTSVKAVLNDILRNIQNFSVKMIYENSYVNNINSLLTNVGKKLIQGDSDLEATPKVQYKLDYNDFIKETLSNSNTLLKVTSSVNGVDPLIDKSNIKELLSGKTKLDDTIIKKILQKYFIQIEDQLSFDSDGITIVTDKKGNKTIYMSTKAQTIEDRYGITYNTFGQQVAQVEKYKGYDIYRITIPQRVDESGITIPKKLVYFWNSKGEIITSKSYQKGSTNINDIKKSIDLRVNNTSIYDYAFMGLKIDDRINGSKRTFQSSLNYNLNNPNIRPIPNDSIIKSLNIPIDIFTTISDTDNMLLSKSLSEVIDYFNRVLPDFYVNDDDEDINIKQLFNDIIDSGEKASIFIYKLNELTQDEQEKASRDYHNRNLLLKINNILNLIHTAEVNNDYSYYVVERSHSINASNRNISSTERDNTEYSVIEIKNPADEFNISDELDARYNRPKTVINLLQSVLNVMESKYHLSDKGVQATILTQEEMESQFQEYAQHKAFIKDGNIYINGTIAKASDALHEYAHLFLGLLKAENFDAYQQLVTTFASRQSSDYINYMSTQRYPNMSLTDLSEEIFAERFGQYLSDKLNITSDESQIFDVVDNMIANITDGNLFDSNVGFNDIFNQKGSMWDMLQRFCSSIRDRMNSSDNIDFTQSKQYRQASNVIKEKLDQGVISEINCK